MARSYNGWPASPTLKTRVIEPVKGVKLRIVDNDNVAEVFTYLVRQFHLRVDDVTKPHPMDDWSFYYRANVNNPTQLSNHASGTAIDLDATEHPNGVSTSRTFTPKQIAEVHEILRELDNVVRWGGDYTRTADAMHFEINVRPGGLRAIGRKLRKGKVKRRLKVGSFNVQTERDWRPDVGDIREALRAEKPDVLALHEASHLYGHLDAPGYDVFQLKPVRQRKGSISNTGNTVIMVRDGLPRHSVVVRMRRFWRGPKHGFLQDPRVHRKIRVRKDGVTWRIMAAHFPFGKDPQTESVRAVRRFFIDPLRRPAIAVMDANMSKATSEERMADPVKAEIAGVGVDQAIYKNCVLLDQETIPKNRHHDHLWLLWLFGK